MVIGSRITELQPFHMEIEPQVIETNGDENLDEKGNRFGKITLEGIVNDEPFACNFCDEKFSLRSHLISHVNSHTGIKSFDCIICEAKFTYHQALVRHERIHTGEKPYACQYCERRFNTKENWLAHERTHTGEKPFGCSFCDAKFAHGSDRKRHERIHTGKLIKGDCKKKFRIGF